MKILSFNGVYVSNSFPPGKTRDDAIQIRREFVSSGLSDYYERQGQDILINPSRKNNTLEIKFVPYRIDRILDDNYSRWNGRFN